MTNVSMKRRGVVYSNKILAIPDTGAEMTVAGKNFLDKLGLCRQDIRNPNTKKLYAANDTEIRVIGTVKVQIEYEG